MKFNIPLLTLATICTVTFCVKLTRPTVAQNLHLNAKSKQVVKVTCADLKDVQTAFKADHFERAINAAKRVLSISTDSEDRIRANTILISSVRSLEGYDAAIKRAEGVYAYVLKTRPDNSKELANLKSILADLKQRRSSYQQTIAQQEKVVKSHPKSNEAAQAALKVATYKQKLGNPKDALAAYEKVMRDYPLTRSGWKAAQEVALLRQPKIVSTSTDTKTDSISVDKSSIEDARKALREGRPSEAERIARQLIASQDSKDRGEAVELLIRAVDAGTGPKAAAKQAWQMACGSSEFKPSYSDVLRLEACVADLIDEHVKENVADKEEKSATEQQVSEVGFTETKTDKSAKQDYVALRDDTPASTRKSHSQTASAGQMSAYGGFPIAAPSLPGGLIGGRPITSTPKQSKRKTPVNPAPIQVAPGNPTSGDDSSTPVQPKPYNPVKLGPFPVRPVLNRWVCDSQYREVENDQQAIRGLMDEHLAEAHDILFADKFVVLSCGTTLASEKIRALGIATSAAIWASGALNDNDLALNICSEYLMPNLESALPKRWDYRSRESILVVVTAVLQKAEKIDSLIDIYKWWISWDDCPNNRDANCARLAELLIGQERYEEAIAYLNMIDENGECAASRSFIPELEAKLQEQQQSNTGQVTNNARGSK